MLKTVQWAVAALLCAAATAAGARGVSPYLPLNLEPEIERQIERVLVLADKPVMTRPIPAGLVLDALPKACAQDLELCRQVGRFLQRYMQDDGVEYASIEGSISRGAKVTLPNEHGLTSSNHFDADAAVYYWPFDHLLFSAGGVVHQGRSEPTGTLMSAGFDSLQLDVGWRDHWWSPMTDSSMLISTEAPTMPSVTVSNYRPLTRIGFSYEAFLSRMSEQEVRLTTGQIVEASPKFGGIRLAIEPAAGWSLAGARVFTYGGGPSSNLSFKDVIDAFIDPSKNQTTGFSGKSIAKQEAALSSRFIFPGRVPFAFYLEYAGDDTSRGLNYLLGKPALSAGVHFPRLGPFDLTYEISDWSNSWYVNPGDAVQNGYLSGITNYGATIGHWFGDWRLPGNAIGGQSNMVRVGWEPPFGGLLEEQVRMITNAPYSVVQYWHGYDALLRYSRPWNGYVVGGEIEGGRDVFGKGFERIAAFLRYDRSFASSSSDLDEARADELDRRGAEVFIDAGANAYKVLIDITNVEPRYQTGTQYAPHVGVGARRAVTEHQDLGVRLEADEIEHHALLAVRMLDYRYRIAGPLALEAFVGAARLSHSEATPAYGWYVGAGAQYRNVLPGWDLGLDWRYGVELARDHLLPTDPQGNRPDSFYNLTGYLLYVSRHF